MIMIAWNRSYKENHETKHRQDAKYGWYRYDTRFALPVYDEDGEVIRYNVFHAYLRVIGQNVLVANPNKQDIL